MYVLGSTAFVLSNADGVIIVVRNLHMFMFHTTQALRTWGAGRDEAAGLRALMAAAGAEALQHLSGV